MHLRCYRHTLRNVAPLVGARIEIDRFRSVGSGGLSLPSWERGLKSVISFAPFVCLCRSPRGSADWNLLGWQRRRSTSGRSPRGSADWNCSYLLLFYLTFVAPLVGARIEIWLDANRTSASWRRSPRGSADWNISKQRVDLSAFQVAPLVGARIEIAKNVQGKCRLRSLPSWERGLK